MRATRLALCIPLVFGVTASAGAQVSTAFSVGGGYFSLSNPIWRKPSGHEEITLGQSGAAYGPRIGFIVNLPKAGFGVDLFGFGHDFAPFAIPRYDGAVQFDTTRTLYDSPRYSLGNMDLTLHWFPAANTLSLYGLLGMAFRTESFDISNAFADWDNGSKSYTEFTYGYGIGARLALLNRIVLNADYRWMPGDLSMTCNDVGRLIEDYGTYGLYECNTDIETSTKNKTRLAALGMSVILGGKRARPAALVH